MDRARRVQRALACVALLVMVGCAGTGKPIVPTTVDQGLVYADGSITAATRTTTQLVHGGVITPQQAVPVYDNLKLASAAMDTAWAAYAAGNSAVQADALTQAKAALDAALALLSQIQSRER